MFNLSFEWTSSTLARDEFENYHYLYGPVADIATLYIASSYFYSDECGKHRAGLNRRVPMGRSTQIVGGSFRLGLNSKVVTFSTRLAVQSSPMFKSNGKKKQDDSFLFLYAAFQLAQTVLLLYSGPVLWWEIGSITPGKADNQVAMSLETPYCYPTNNCAQYYD